MTDKEARGGQKQTEGMQMEDQGPSYSSSYTESTPGETIENRRASLREAEVPGEHRSNPNEQSDRGE